MSNIGFRVGDRVYYSSSPMHKTNGKGSVVEINRGGDLRVKLDNGGMDAGSPAAWRHLIDWSAPLEAYHEDGRVEALGELRDDPIAYVWTHSDGNFWIDKKTGEVCRGVRGDGWKLRNRVVESIEYPNVTSREQADRIARQRMSIDATHTATVDPTERMIAMNVTGMVCIDGAWAISTDDGCVALASWLSDPTPQPSVSPDLVDRMVRLVREFAGAEYKQNFGPIWSECRAIAALLLDERDTALLYKARELAAPFTDGERQDVLDGKYDNHAAVYGALAALRDAAG